jgi:hypothetical protein
VIAAIIGVFNAIWSCRNNQRFKDIKPSLNVVFTMVCSSVSLSCNVTSLSAGPSMSEFTILKFFKVNLHRPKAQRILEVIWQPPLNGWIKCNTDGTSLGNPGLSACAGFSKTVMVLTLAALLLS